LRDGQGGFPFGGEGGASAAALFQGAAVEAGFARGGAGVAGCAQQTKEGGVLARLAAVEGAGHVPVCSQAKSYMSTIRLKVVPSAGQVEEAGMGIIFR
jgi:hypothetical protein